MHASSGNHFEMVNRLLDCKEIDVNVQNAVSGKMLIASHSRHQFSSPIFFFLICFFLINILLMVKTCRMDIPR